MTEWIKEIPDITVNVCNDYFGALPKPPRGHSEEIAWQMVLSSTAFMIEHPDKAKDGQSVALSGLLGAIKAYQAILKQDSASRWAHMDKLIQLREQGKLDDFVSETLRKCERDEEQEDPNTLHAQAYDLSWLSNSPYTFLLVDPGAAVCLWLTPARRMRTAVNDSASRQLRFVHL